MDNDKRIKGEEVGNYLIALGKKWSASFNPTPDGKGWIAKRGILNKLNRRWIEYKAFKAFRWFIDQSDEDEYLYALLFFLRVRDDLAALDMVNCGYMKALKRGTFPKGTMPNGKAIDNIYDFMFYRWPVLYKID